MRFTLAAPSAGMRQFIAALIHHRWPQALIDEIEPEANVPLVCHADSQLLIVSEPSAWVPQPSLPPLLVLTTHPDQDEKWRAAGAIGILPKAMLSQTTLLHIIADWLGIPCQPAPLFHFQFKSASIAQRRIPPFPKGDPGGFSMVTEWQRLKIPPSPPLEEGGIADLAGASNHCSFELAMELVRDAAPFRFHLNGTPHAPVIAHYQKPILLTSGPEAQTFYAERQSDGLPVVVKIITSTPIDDGALEPFCQRYRFFSRLQGLSTVRFLDAGIARHWPYVVLEYLAAGNLRQRIEAGMRPAAAVQVLLQLLAALSSLHAGQYAHLDLKPENIAFRQNNSGQNNEGQNNDAVLIDFDAACQFGATTQHIYTGAVLGTPSYMSPEQALGQPIDGRSDLYSCGVIFYEMLTGKKPFSGESDAQVVYKHLHDDIPLLPKPLRPFQAIIDKLMAKDRDERYPDCTTLVADLLPFLENP